MGSYITLLKESEIRYTEKRSVFIGYAKPVKTEEECIDFINDIKSRNKSATHNVYAYIVNDNGMLASRYSDDGEPQGTAGIPVLDVLRKQDLVNCVVVVTRYFGGVLLGAPGLVRAYSKAASLSVSEAGICRMVLCVPVTITVDYHYYGKIQNALSSEQSQTPEFGTEVSITYIIPEEDISAIEKTVNDITNGNNVIAYGEKNYFPLP